MNILNFVTSITMIATRCTEELLTIIIQLNFDAIYKGKWAELKSKINLELEILERKNNKVYSHFANLVKMAIVIVRYFG